MVLAPILEGLYLFTACWFLAKLEIEIEGPDGWAAKLPTWRVTSPWLMRLTNHKHLTGYHLYFNLFLLSIFHLPFCFVPITLAAEGKILALYFLLVWVWDFQWFVWNPAWGVRRFFREKIWWQPKKLFGFPVEYYTATVVSLGATLLLDPKGISDWLLRFGVLLTATAVSVVTAEACLPNA